MSSGALGFILCDSFHGGSRLKNYQKKEKVTVWNQMKSLIWNFCKAFPHQGHVPDGRPFLLWRVKSSHNCSLAGQLLGNREIHALHSKDVVQSWAVSPSLLGWRGDCHNKGDEWRSLLTTVQWPTPEWHIQDTNHRWMTNSPGRLGARRHQKANETVGLINPVNHLWNLELLLLCPLAVGRYLNSSSLQQVLSPSPVHVHRGEWRSKNCGKRCF